MTEPKKVKIEIGAATIKGAAIIKGDATAADVDTAKQVAVGEGNTQTDTAGGAATQGNVVSDRFTGRDDLRNYQDHRSGNVTFQNPDNAVLLTAIFATNDRVAAVDSKLDNLPDRVAKLEVRIPLSTWILLAILIAILVFSGVFVAIRLSV